MRLRIALRLIHKEKARLSTSLLESGGDLLSRTVTSQVPSALKGLTSVFGMGTGGTPSSLPPEMVSCLRKPFSFLYCVSVSPGLPVFLFFLLQARRCFHTLTTAQYRFSWLTISINLRAVRLSGYGARKHETLGLIREETSRRKLADERETEAGRS